MHSDKKIFLILLIALFVGNHLFGQKSKELVPFFHKNKLSQYDSLIDHYAYTNPNKALEITYNLLKDQQYKLDNLEKAQLYSKLRKIYHLLHDPYNALTFGYRALLIYKLYNQDKLYLRELNRLACIYREENLYDNFIISFLRQAIKKFEGKYNDLLILTKVNYALLSQMSNHREVYPVDSLFNEASSISSLHDKVTTYLTLSEYYLELQNYTKAIATLKKALFIEKKTRRIIRLNLYLARCYLKQRNVLAADKILDRIHPLIISHKDVIAQATWDYLKSLVKISQDQFDLALQFAQQGLRISIENNILGLQAKFYQILSQLYMSQSKPDLAFMSFNNYMQTKDSIHSLTKYYNLYNIIQKLSSIDITRENLILKQQAQYEQLKNKQQKLVILFFGLSALFLTLLLAFVFYLFRISYKAEQRLRRFAQISLEAIIIIDNGSIIEYNDKFKQLTGYDDEEIKTLKLSDIIDPILASEILETDSILNFETYLKRKNGTQFKAEILSREFKYSNRKKVKVISLRDVSDFYSTQKELIESQIKFKTLIDTSPDGVIITDTKEKITFISQVAKQILGIEKTENPIGKDISKVFNIKDKIKLLLFTSSQNPMEFIYSLRSGGNNKYIETKLSIVKSVDLDPIAVFIVIRDVTQRIQIQEALKQSEQKFRELYNKATDGIVIIDAQGVIIDANPASENIFQISTNLLIGQNLEDFLPVNFASPLQFKKFINSKDKLETPIIQANGNTIYTQISVSKLKQAPESYLLIIRDITEILKTQEKLRKYAEKLEVSNNAKAKLFSIISHDLRGPIGNLKSMIELILENPTSFNLDELTLILTELKNSSVRTYELLENLLYWAKSQLNQIEYSPQKFDVKKPVEQTVNILRQVAKQKEIQIIDQIQPDTFFVNADIEMVKIILRNLISNAIKFTPRGGTITLLGYEDEKFVTVGVKDTGVGIPYEKLVKIFDNETFFTSYGTENEKGTGLGLQIVKEFVSKNKGRLWVESKPGRGSIFYFTLPKINS